MRRSSKPQPALGTAIRELRGKTGMTQEAVAQRAGITVAHLSGIERGHANPSWAAVMAIADALDVSIVEIARGVEKHLG
ncbi:MAG TPA: helix-turn-helix transcriptional regulator [Solirubrobacterales bacterium]|nr:helix-turn-helix transcriptional regulator [Solirubrobacterales bacterium]